MPATTKCKIHANVRHKELIETKQTIGLESLLIKNNEIIYKLKAIKSS